eukprot:364899-Chlamydomonas_euryale.AAC.33
MHIDGYLTFVASTNATACPSDTPCCPHVRLHHSQIAKRRRAHQEAHPDAKIISLGIGDTTEPLPPTITKALTDAAAGLGTRQGYSG